MQAILGSLTIRPLLMMTLHHGPEKSLSPLLRRVWSSGFKWSVMMFQRYVIKAK